MAACGNVLVRRITVKQVLESRYPAGKRPLDWEQRREGIEVIETADGERLCLFSDGGQSTPAPGWDLVLCGASPEVPCGVGDKGPAFKWTLYGIAPAVRQK
ncbi:MAG TPA: hypothetical protein PLP17_08745 [Oligoflexia bacterium]|nr:hypothetical protein [Oligoflexia bacterium]